MWTSRDAARRVSGTPEEACREPSPHELRTFVLVCEELHFGRAARRLGAAQSSVSETVRRLEAKLGAVLLERTSRRVELTSAGAALLPLAREVLASIAAAREAIAPTQTSDSGECLRVGIEAHGFAELNRPIFARFRDRHPDIAVVLREFGCSARSFFRAHLDVALARTPIVDERLVVREMATEPRGLLVPQGHPAARAEGASIEDFLDEPFVAVTRDARGRAYWLAEEHRGGEPAHVELEAATTQEFLEAIAYLGTVSTSVRSAGRWFSGFGVAFVSAVGLSPATVSVVTRAGETRQAVHDFVRAVRTVVDQRTTDETLGFTRVPDLWDAEPAHLDDSLGAAEGNRHPGAPRRSEHLGVADHPAA